MVQSSDLKLFAACVMMQCYPWKSKTKQRTVFRMIHVKDSLLPMGNVWSLDFLDYYFRRAVLSHDSVGSYVEVLDITCCHFAQGS